MSPQTTQEIIDAEVANNVQDKEIAATTRVSQWKDAVQGELQDLISRASEIRQLIASAKTETKRAFYKKKFAKIQPQVLQMVAAIQHLDRTDAQLKEEKPEDAAA